ncbi:VOC family protein [Gulosibacter molinativorax]|uniref:Glyoxalase n=1 Tax=Gulosibacter molinativorax TaxID=256821 RepID=A0ABT7C5L4_9MICO|nr:VOC family protein [Gulosibacter molinativorax]MDJ1370493.1 glyoxalase [Gulosibacter molinativorax]QUY62096.1 Glyoxalase/bleomycin resistance protein/dioxygenase [Gulosibacter molinativorax]
MSRPVHFEIHATDVESTKEFYAASFGWEYDDYSEYAGTPYFGVRTGPEEAPGINGAIMQRREDALTPGVPVNGAVLTMGVEDFDATAAAILAAGGREALPKYALPGMAWQGYFLDPDGNVFGIHQPDENAA